MEENTCRLSKRATIPCERMTPVTASLSHVVSIFESSSSAEGGRSPVFFGVSPRTLFCHRRPEHPFVGDARSVVRNRDNPGAKKVRTRVGRGNAAGQGTTAGKGKHGQNSRSGPISLNRLLPMLRVPSFPRSLCRLHRWSDPYLQKNPQGGFHQSVRLEPCG